MDVRDEMARCGLHLVQDGPWTSVFVVMAPACDCYQYIALG